MAGRVIPNAKDPLPALSAKGAMRAPEKSQKNAKHSIPDTNQSTHHARKLCHSTDFVKVDARSHAQESRDCSILHRATTKRHPKAMIRNSVPTPIPLMQNSSQCKNARNIAALTPIP